MSVYVQYGAGWSAPDGWINFDASPTLRIERLPLVGRSLGRLARNPEPFPNNTRYGDIIKGLPIADGSVDGLYASHVLEHLTLADMRRALANSYRMLKPGGVFRLIVPDLRARAAAYLQSDNDPEAAYTFMRLSHLGQEGTRSTGLGRIRQMLGNSSHLWMYDYPSMARELESVGFVEIRQARFGDAADRMFDRVEDEHRFIDDGMVELAIEAKRPASAG